MGLYLKQTKVEANEVHKSQTMPLKMWELVCIISFLLVKTCIQILAAFHTCPAFSAFPVMTGQSPFIFEFHRTEGRRPQELCHIPTSSFCICISEQTPGAQRLFCFCTDTGYWRRINVQQVTAFCPRNQPRYQGFDMLRFRFLETLKLVHNRNHKSTSPDPTRSAHILTPTSSLS